MVLFTAYGDVEMAVRAIKAGAVDFVLKPWENDKLLATLQTAVQTHQSKQEKKAGGATLHTDNVLIGDSPPCRK